ncbi:MAG: sugar ABC transporter permease [Spirochaetes bacterium]|nr:sugar ABC transporter permease [Spirochaetota bacterium]
MSTKNSKLKNDWWVPYAFLALPLIMYLIWVIIPVFQSFLYSFSKRDSIFIGFDFIGLKNYLRLFSDKTFWIAIKNNFFWLVLFVALPVPLGLFIAMLFDNDYPGNKVFKTLFYIPMTLSFAVIGTIWAWIYHPDFGTINTFLEMIGLSGLKQQWIGDKRIMTFSLIFVGVWRQVPYVMILYLAGLKNVPKELMEVSMVDGANWGQRFRHILLPLLAPATIVSMTISVIDSLRAFDIVYVMTNAKARAAEVLSTYMYNTAFTYSDYGYGSTIAVIQFIITFCFIIIYLNNVMKSEI